MGLRLDYRCETCSYRSGMLSDAQTHANDTQHNIAVIGQMTPEMNTLKVSDALTPQLAAKVREQAILRLAKQRNLVTKGKVK
jgi:hypothetical protein